MLGVRDEELTAGLEGMPVVGPSRGDALELGERLAGPLVDNRVPAGSVVLPGVPGREDHSLGQAQEVPAVDLPVLPLLGRERRYLLEGSEPAAPPLEDGRRGVEIVGAGAGPDARDREERPVADGEELGVLAARSGERRPGLEAAPGPAEQQQLGVAVAAVHPRRPARDVLGELRYGEEVMATHLDWLDGSGARGGNPLDLGQGHWHGITTATGLALGK